VEERTEHVFLGNLGTVLSANNKCCNIVDRVRYPFHTIPALAYLTVASFNR
jgi:hypothetical protein